VIGGVVLDTTALLDIVTGATIYGQAFVSTAAERGVVLLIPSTSLSQAWATVPSERLPLLELLLELPVVVVDDMDLTTARAAGLVLKNVFGILSARLRAWECGCDHGGLWRLPRVIRAAMTPI
jgi:hypothetical protein